MKIKFLLSLGVLGAVLALNLCAPADDDFVVFKSQTYCLGEDDCRDFANWGATVGGYVALYDADGHTISDYLWINPNGEMTFESELPGGGFAQLPPAGMVLLGGLIEDGTPQDLGQYFPAGEQRGLFVESKVDTTPEPSTLLLFGPAAAFLFGRARRLWRR